MVRGAKRREKKITREPYQTVRTVYFILGILRTDLWSLGNVSMIENNRFCSFALTSYEVRRNEGTLDCVFSFKSLLGNLVQA